MIATKKTKPKSWSKCRLLPSQWKPEKQHSGKKWKSQQAKSKSYCARGHIHKWSKSSMNWKSVASSTERSPLSHLLPARVSASTLPSINANRRTCSLRSARTWPKKASVHSMTRTWRRFCLRTSWLHRWTSKSSAIRRLRCRYAATLLLEGRKAMLIS